MLTNYRFNNKALPAICIICISLTIAVTGKMHSEFSSTDSSYAYSVTVTTRMSCTEASSLLFSKEAVRYFSDFADSINFTDIHTSSHVAEIRFRKWFYTGYSRYKRVLYSPDSITIDLQEFRHNWNVIPELKKITIRYYFIATDDGCLVMYSQTAIADRRIKSGYRKVVKRQLNNFARKLSEYLRREKWVGPT